MTNKFAPSLRRSVAAMVVAVMITLMSQNVVLAQSTSSPDPAQRPTIGGKEKATGLRIGSFLLKPEVHASGEYNDNYLFEEDDVDTTFIARTSPLVSLSSTWSRHALRVSVGAEQGVFFEDSDDNYLDYSASFRGELDVTRSTRVGIDLGFSHLHESRGTDDSPLSASEPVEFDRLSAKIRTDFHPGRFRLSPFAGVLALDFDDATLESGFTSNEDDRDRNEFRYGGEIGFEFSEGYEAFVMGELANVDYSADVDDNGFNRDSTGLRALGGVKIDVTRLITASLSTGFVTRDYDDKQLDAAEGFAIDASAIWAPTALTTFKVTGARDIKETTVAGASGTVELFGRVEVDHALRRNLILSAFASAANEDFEGVDREDDNFRFGLGAEWLISENFSAEARYAYEDENSSVTDSSYDVNRFFIGFSARY